MDGMYIPSESATANLPIWVRCANDSVEDGFIWTAKDIGIYRIKPKGYLGLLESLFNPSSYSKAYDTSITTA